MRSAKYAITFLLLALACAATAAQLGGAAALVILYGALSFMVLAIAYAGAGPGLLGKRSDGTISLAGRLFFAPYLLLNAAAFWLYRTGRRGPAFAQVAPNLFFGRRLTAREARAAGVPEWSAVLDLAAEFAGVAPLRSLPGYRSVPILDATAPSRDQLAAAVDWLKAAVRAGPVYVHCALGHGRSATVVLAYLLATQQVAGVAEGLALLRALRPCVGLSPQQRRRLDEFASA